MEIKCVVVMMTEKVGVEDVEEGVAVAEVKVVVVAEWMGELVVEAKESLRENLEMLELGLRLKTNVVAVARVTGELLRMMQRKKIMLTTPLLKRPQLMVKHLLKVMLKKKLSKIRSLWKKK